MPVVSPPPPHGMTTASNSGESSHELEPDRAVARHHRLVLDRMRRTARRRPRSPRSTIVCHHTSCGTGMISPPSALDARRASRAAPTRARRSLARHAGLARGPGDALRHVAGARGDDAARELARRGGADAESAPRSLNEPIGCRHSSFSQISRRRRRAARAACARRRRRSARARGGSRRAGSIVALLGELGQLGAHAPELGEHLVLDQARRAARPAFPACRRRPRR